MNRAALLPLPVVLALTFAIVPAARAADDGGAAAPPSKEMTAGGNEQMRFFLHGPMPRDAKKAPADGYRLLLVLPGGDGAADFQPFVSDILKNACPRNFIVAQLVAPRWSDQEDRIVWPSEKRRDPKMKFTTEAFIDAVVAEVQKTHKIDPKHVYALAWSSSGPAVYAAALRPKTPITGCFVAMSVYKPAQLPPVQKLKGRSFYILHSPQDFIPMTFPTNAEKQLRAAGANTKLVTYEGGHGWQGDFFGTIRTGMDWLEQQATTTPTPPSTRTTATAR
jgi:poly(3-hydroxybutyrate) depolymerase